MNVGAYSINQRVRGLDSLFTKIASNFGGVRSSLAFRFIIYLRKNLWGQEMTSCGMWIDAINLQMGWHMV